ncbi:exonuclease SbcCD subunit D [Jeotgalicoccus marinus]|uniref:exonuclease SbcCD subunit D n=1 Tax=Jeotgalicoccus marinus TaxID=516700 RepID=UPI000426CE72|nr:exonuclease SbcCD subunit D [Jeotgalicoccus marinus]
MRILHTGDWHIGRKMNGLDLIDDQRYILDQLQVAIEDNQIDTVVVAGDIFDRVNPSQSALKLANDTLYKINIELGKNLIVISGNHDSRERINYGSEWFKATDFYINTDLSKVAEPVTIDDVDFYLVPHVEVLEARVYFNDDTIQTHQDAYENIVKEINKHMNKEQTNVLVGHLYLNGSIESDSERPLSMGLSEAVSADVFSDFDYTLLGHLHHPFAVDHGTAFYSGSLLKYSFSETNQPKGYRIIDTKKKEVTFAPIKPLHEVKVYSGDYEDLIKQKVTFDDDQAYFKFELSNMSYVNEPMSKIKLLYPNTLELKPLIEDVASDLEAVDISTTSDIEIYESFIEHTLDRTMTDFDKDMFDQHFAGEDNETE